MAISWARSGRARTPAVPGDPGLGYEGGYMAVTNYLRAIRPDTAPKFGCCFKTKPGEQAQAEFTDEPGGVQEVYLVSFVLGCSRWLWGGSASARSSRRC